MSLSENLTLGGGCFWCIEAIYKRIKGVEEVIPGYAGSNWDEPTYEEVCTGITDHAEVCHLKYNSDVISDSRLLDIFFHLHDPTTKDRQGADIGSQYRSVILYEDQRQKELAIQKIQEIQTHLSDIISTQVIPLKKFYPAEKIHHNYYDSHSNEPYCSITISPKIKKLSLIFPKEYKGNPNLPDG